MQSVFPDFKDFGHLEEDDIFGFMGAVTGTRTGTCYHVTLACARLHYPHVAPRIRIHPLPGTVLCFDEFGDWSKQSTCATRVLQIKRCIDRFDGTTCPA